jgi:hypothetical protein
VTAVLPSPVAEAMVHAWLHARRLRSVRRALVACSAGGRTKRGPSLHARPWLGCIIVAGGCVERKSAEVYDEVLDRWLQLPRDLPHNSGPHALGGGCIATDDQDGSGGASPCLTYNGAGVTQPWKA